jgi:two-component system phosphate regulon sensor histidine kinase PhoR
MALSAQRFSETDSEKKIPPQNILELDQLATALNEISNQLYQTRTSLNLQRKEQQAILSSMDEGVVAIDPQERIIHMNRAAGEILSIDHKKTKYAQAQTILPDSPLRTFFRAALRSPKKTSRDLFLSDPSPMQIQVSSRPLLDDSSSPIGALIVLRNLTQLRHLETVRADFVANVSHELKTPITSIQGFIETLLSDDWAHEPDARRFLEIISQQTDRLNAIIDDLLTLSRLEQKQQHMPLTETRLAPILSNAINLCQIQAQKKQITISTHGARDLSIPANAPLLEQAILNLLANAIHYSDPEKNIQIWVKEERGTVAISIIDQGVGIDPSHLDRLFERFYRVDTARSRSLGGTGLGLSIVKHIVQAHNGTVEVESSLGKGSTFTIRLRTQDLASQNGIRT